MSIVKDRVGRSGCDPPRGYLPDNIFFNIPNRKSHNIPKIANVHTYLGI